MMGAYSSTFISTFMGDNSLQNISMRAFLGVLILLIHSYPDRLAAWGILCEVVLSMALSPDSPIHAVSLFLQIVFATYGAILLIGIGLNAAFLSHFGFNSLTAHAVTGIYLHFERVLGDFHRKGFNSVFGSIILVLAALLGTGLGLLLRIAG
jgi:hypothetical protein